MQQRHQYGNGMMGVHGRGVYVGVWVRHAVSAAYLTSFDCVPRATRQEHRLGRFRPVHAIARGRSQDHGAIRVGDPESPILTTSGAKTENASSSVSLGILTPSSRENAELGLGTLRLGQMASSDCEGAIEVRVVRTTSSEMGYRGVTPRAGRPDAPGDSPAGVRARSGRAPPPGYPRPSSSRDVQSGGRRI